MRIMNVAKRFVTSMLICVMVSMTVPSADVLAATNGWVRIGGFTYYYVNGYKQYGWIYLDNKYYYLDPYDGDLWTNAVVDETWVVGADGSLQYNKWIMVNAFGEFEVWEYADSNGQCLRGWHTIGNKKYYFDDYYGAIQGGAFCIDGKYYVFNKDHSLAKNKWLTSLYTWRAWYSEDPVKQEYYSIKYYADSNGRAVTGWKKISGKWYFFDAKNEDFPCLMVRGFKNIKGKRYFFTPKTGVLKTGGWFKVKQSGKTKWYYAYKDGSLARGTKKIGGKKYKFDKKTGAWIK